METKRITYPIDLIQQVINYLATRPFAEVVEIIQRLQTQGVPFVPPPPTPVEQENTDD